MEPILAIGLAAGLARLILHRTEDPAQEINAQHLCTGHQGRGTTLKIRNAIGKILQQHPHAKIKIGKTVQPDKRLKGKDYQQCHTMYLVYKTSSEAYVSHYESYFIDTFQDKLINKHGNSTGRAAAVKGNNYLYVTVAD